MDYDTSPKNNLWESTFLAIAPPVLECLQPSQYITYIIKLNFDLKSYLYKSNLKSFPASIKNSLIQI